MVMGSPDSSSPNQVSGLSYNICLRRESGYCAVEWSAASPYTGHQLPSYYKL